MNVGGVASEAVGDVALLVDELSRAVELTLMPTVPHEERSQAYNACERYLTFLLFYLYVYLQRHL